jgi:hypothetical protein
VQVTAVDNPSHEVMRVALIREFTVKHAMLTDTQATPRSMSSDLLDVEVRGVCR